MTRTVLVAGGGTAGHVFPAIAVAQELRRLEPDLEPVFIGVADRLESTLVPAAGFTLHEIQTVSIPRRLSPKLASVPAALRRAMRHCEQIAREVGAIGAVTFGGYVSFPVDWAVARLHLPLVIHEQNAVPGLANRIAARWADRIAVTVPGSADRFRHPERVAVTGNPVRNEVLAVDREAERPAARERLGLRPDVPTLLVFGGSQGARSLNNAVIAAHPHWPDLPLQILHAAGTALYRDAAAGWERARASRPGMTVRLVEFLERMADAYAAADVVVCRAGATSIAELTALGLPAVLVPYPHATADHQTLNAQALAQAGGAVVIEDDRIDGAALVEAVTPLLTDPARYAEMASSSRAFGRRDAATNVARLLLDLLPQRRTT